MAVPGQFSLHQKRIGLTGERSLCVTPQAAAPVRSGTAVLAPCQRLGCFGAQFEGLRREGEGKAAGLNGAHNGQIDALAKAHVLVEIRVARDVHDPHIDRRRTVVAEINVKRIRIDLGFVEQDLAEI